jgi:hypothetical protein
MYLSVINSNFVTLGTIRNNNNVYNVTVSNSTVCVWVKSHIETSKDGYGSVYCLNSFAFSQLTPMQREVIVFLDFSSL